MINKLALTQLLSQNMKIKYAALTDEDKVALLAFKQNKEDLYTVIALDMPALKHIEVHIHQIGRQLDLTLYTEQEEISMMLSESLPKLIYLLEDKGYHLSRCSCQLALREEYTQNFINRANQSAIRSIDFQI